MKYRRAPKMTECPPPGGLGIETKYVVECKTITLSLAKAIQSGRPKKLWMVSDSSVAVNAFNSNQPHFTYYRFSNVLDSWKAYDITNYYSLYSLSWHEHALFPVNPSVLAV
ncbi:hypothetical protein IFM89_038502 [Coptis chinensis]|uniref:Uncharacterized protein n=1 Tax=Coptis chinensis TaxID=261450 RepID=A0A835J3Y7_9MAGN|nr:hypothetical protein IFM89_038502 [Coptis chinensis]